MRPSIGKMAVAGLLVLGMVGSVSGASYSVVDANGGGNVNTDINELYGYANGYAHSESEFIYQGGGSFTIEELSYHIQDKYIGSSVGEVNVEIYIEQAGIDYDYNDGTLVKSSFTPLTSAGTETISLDSHYKLESGKKYTVNFYTSYINCGGSYCQFAGAGGNTDKEKFAYSEGGFDRTVGMYSDFVFFGTKTKPPKIDNLSVSPEPILIDQNVSYTLNASKTEYDISQASIELFDDGSQVYQDSQSFSSSSVSYTWSDVFVPQSDGSLDARFEATDDAGATATEWLNRTIDETPPSLEIFKPESPTKTRTGLPLNYTVSDVHLDNDSCRYSKDGGTNFSLPDCGNTTVDFGTVGNHNLTVYASDTYNNTGSVLRKFFVDNRNEIFLEDSVSGSSISDFQVTITNGDESIGGSTSDGRFEFYTSELPKGDIEITVKASGYQTETFTYSNVGDSFTLNTTYQMERAGLTLDAYSEIGSNQIQFDFSASNSTNSFSKNNVDIFQKNFTELQNLGFPTGDVTLTVNKDGYKARKYFVTLDENTKSVLDAYLLESGEGIFMTVKVTGNNEALKGALVSIQREYGTSYKTVTQSYTKSDGTASFYLSPDISYRIQLSHPNYKVFTGTFSPVNYQYEPLEIRLSEKSNFTESTVWSEVSYKLTPQFQTLNMSDDYTFNWSVSDSSGSLSSVGLELVYENTTLNETSVSGSPSGSTVSLDLNLSKYNVSFGDDFIVKGSFVRNEQLFVYKKRYSIVTPVKEGVSSFSALLGSASGLSSVAKGFVALIFSILSMIAVSETNVINKGAGAVGLAVLGLFVLEQWFPTFPFFASIIAYLGVMMYR